MVRLKSASDVRSLFGVHLGVVALSSPSLPSVYLTFVRSYLAVSHSRSSTSIASQTAFAMILCTSNRLVFKRSVHTTMPLSRAFVVVFLLLQLGYDSCGDRAGSRFIYRRSIDLSDN